MKRLIRFSQMDEKEKQVKYDVLRNEFEKVMHIEEKRVEEVMKRSALLAFSVVLSLVVGIVSSGPMVDAKPLRG